MRIRLQMLVMLLILSCGAAWAEETTGTAPATAQPQAPPLETAKLRQLEAWRSAGRNEKLETWVREHPEQARAAVAELVVDVYASPWLMIGPQYSNSEALLKVLAAELGLKLPETPAECRWQGPRPPLEEVEPPAYCQALPGYEELSQLAGDPVGLSDRAVYDLPSEEPASAVAFVGIDEKALVRSLRGKIQKALFEGAWGEDLKARREILSDALSQARQAGFRELEVLIRLGQMRTEFEAAQAPAFTDPKPDPRPLLALAKGYLAQARELADSLYSVRLQAAVSLAEARWLGEEAAFAEAGRLIKTLQRSEREVLQLELADARMLTGYDDEGHRLYQQLLAQAASEVKLEVVDRLLYMARRKDLEQLRARFAQEQDPKLRASLMRAFVKLGDEEPLWRLAASAGTLAERQNALTTLSSYSVSDDTSKPERMIPFLKDADPVIRNLAASALANSPKPEHKALLLPFLESAEPSLRHSALFAAASFDRPDLLPKVLPLLRPENRDELILVVELVRKWGSDAQIPALEALQPRIEPWQQLRVRLAIAHLQGPQAWLAERIRQAEEPESFSYLWLNLVEALKQGFITKAQLKPYLNHPDKQIRESVQAACEDRMP